MKRVLVTGATGFIGRHLVRALRRDGHDVALLTRHRASADPLTREHPEGLTVLTGRFDDPALLDRAGAVQEVYHLAVGKTVERKDDAGWRTNVDSSRALFDWAAAHGVTRFFHASSIEAQGPLTPGDAPQFEDGTCRPVSPYGESKLAGERVLLEAAGRAACRLLIGRIGNVYGPGSNGFVRPIASAVARSSRFLSDDDLLAALTQPIYVSDLAQAILELAASPADGIVNIVGDKTVSVRDWIDAVADLTDRAVAPGGEPMTEPEQHLHNYFFGAHPYIDRVYSRETFLRNCPDPFSFDLLKGTAYTLEALAANSPVAVTP